jgi:hypothetical protein
LSNSRNVYDFFVKYEKNQETAFSKFSGEQKRIFEKILRKFLPALVSQHQKENKRRSTSLHIVGIFLVRSPTNSSLSSKQSLVSNRVTNPPTYQYQVPWELTGSSELRRLGFFERFLQNVSVG